MAEKPAAQPRRRRRWLRLLLVLLALAIIGASLVHRYTRPQRITAMLVERVRSELGAELRLGGDGGYALLPGLRAVLPQPELVAGVRVINTTDRVRPGDRWHLGSDGKAMTATLIARLVEEYADAQHAHRVLTEDVKFLQDEDRARVLDQEREVVRGFARVVAALRPDLEQAALSKPLTMLLFGMINWMFTWMRPEGALDYDAIAPIVADLFLGGLGAVEAPVAVAAAS